LTSSQPLRVCQVVERTSFRQVLAVGRDGTLDRGERNDPADRSRIVPKRLGSCGLGRHIHSMEPVARRAGVLTVRQEGVVANRRKIARALRGSKEAATLVPQRAKASAFEGRVNACRRGRWMNWNVELVPLSCPTHSRFARPCPNESGSLWTKRPSQTFRSRINSLSSVVTSHADVHLTRHRCNDKRLPQFAYCDRPRAVTSMTSTTTSSWTNQMTS